MGILNRLWTRVWSNEEDRKREIMHREIAQFTQEAERRRLEHTDTQKACLKHGGPEFEDVRVVNTTHHNLYQQAVQLGILQQNALQNANISQSALGMATNIGTPAGSGLYYPITNNIGGITGRSPTSVNVLNTTHNMIYGSLFADAFYQALRGIEQASLKKPDGNHRYDDLALGIQDYRYFNSSEISLLGLTSFCLSNMMEVEPVVMLLEGYGMTVV